MDGPADGVTHIGQYTGYGGTVDTIGVIKGMDLYDLGRESCSDQDQCHIKADRHDDGATNATFSDSIRLNLQDGNEPAETRDMEYQVDFQAFAVDRAGNIGFSDADPTNPRFINDLGEPAGERTKAGNVLGYYSAHVITLDEKDPWRWPNTRLPVTTGSAATGRWLTAPPSWSCSMVRSILPQSLPTPSRSRWTKTTMQSSPMST